MSLFVEIRSQGLLLVQLFGQPLCRRCSEKTIIRVRIMWHSFWQCRCVLSDKPHFSLSNFHFVLFHLSIGYMAGPLLASGLYLLCEFQCPCGLHCVISGLLAGGALVSAQCCVASITHRGRYGGFCDCSSLCFCFICHSNP